ncbi:MAG: hypothetical protein EOO90_01345 [Pedobacter sp.]|nr:MAG: hypothetical protein EOO90_01345 [Pedobacter sp.]
MSIRIIISFLFVSCFIACGEQQKKDNQSKNEVGSNDGSEKNKLNFVDVDGILFHEVKRRFKDNLSFNKDGFQQEPSWTIQVKGKDSMMVYSPTKKGMETVYLQYDHGQVYNFMREFFRVKLITKDSLLLQRLHVQGRSISGDDDYRSEVYCTYYSENYIKNKLKTTVEELRKPSKADSLFISQLAKKTFDDPGNPALAFAGRQPAVFIPNSKNVTAEKISTIDPLNRRRAFVDYLYPNYRLEINKSYKEFNYSFTVIVDAWGKLYVNQVNGVLEDDKKHRKKLLDGITEVYLQNLFVIQPGRTLGIRHSSEVYLQVIGKKG